ncbi:putative NAD-dependent epimerase/dehydratase [Nitrospira sp. KM1]|uniref:NAD-dependent epimerase/dehydratase family protein n=1 Tax=Nitrospira sp. KM1 TaxID=1936990 RepID=UPI0013A75168|nr:NAD-dependent epimerase/dehydratase family protein [Nitrospira sp. KM1]BCA54203.1 putative NAD-dependent epimerase/dehydratase [Nitrospira sp. KM1]
MTTALVTGAGGFLGRALTDELHRAGYRVRALVHAPPSAGFSASVEVMTGDIRDSSCTLMAAKGCETVIHLAGKAHAFDDRGVSEEDYQSINVEGTQRVLAGAREGGARRFVFASSVKVFGETTGTCVNEEAPAAPATPYARSKWAAEQAVSSYGSSSGMTTVSLRLPMVYGPTQKGNLFRMIAAIDAGRFPPLPPLKTVRSMLHVKNFVRGILAVLRAPAVPRSMYVMTDGRPYSTAEVYDLLRKGLGMRPARWRIPLPCLTAAARAGDLLQSFLHRPLPVSSANLNKIIGQAWYSPQNMITDLGYRPDHTFESAVPEIVRFYRHSSA